MVKKFTVHAEGLTQIVKIAFTLTPRKCHSIGNLELSPIAFKVMEFLVNDTQPQSFEWYYELGFSLWDQKLRGRGISLQSATGYCRVPPTHYVELTCPQTQLPPRWSKSRPSEEYTTRSQNMVVAYNRTSEAKLMTLGFLKETFDPLIPESYSFHPMACYRIAPKFALYAPSSVVLQAYVVDTKDKKNQRLLPADLAHPLFDEPLECDGLAAASTWKLSQTPGGRLTLEREQTALLDWEAAAVQIEQLTKSLGDTTVIASRADQRVGVAEERIKVMEETHIVVYQAARAQLSIIPGLQSCSTSEATPPEHASPSPTIQFRSSAVPPQALGPPTLFNTSDLHSGTNTLLSSHQSELQWRSTQKEL